MATTVRRKLSNEEIADVDRLRAIYDAKKLTTGMTQVQLAEACGWESQGTVAQYFSKKMALNLDAAFRLSKALDVPLDAISPRLAARAVELFGATQAGHGHAQSFEQLLGSLHGEIERMDNDGRLAIARLVKTYEANPAEGTKIAKAILALVGTS